MSIASNICQIRCKCFFFSGQNSFLILQSVVEHISDMVTNVHRLNSQDLNRLISVIRQQREKLDSVHSYPFPFISHSIFFDRIMNIFTIVYSKSSLLMYITNEVA